MCTVYKYCIYIYIGVPSTIFFSCIPHLQFLPTSGLKWPGASALVSFYRGAWSLPKSYTFLLRDSCCFREYIQAQTRDSLLSCNSVGHGGIWRQYIHLHDLREGQLAAGKRWGVSVFANFWVGPSYITLLWYQYIYIYTSNHIYIHTYSLCIDIYIYIFTMILGYM